MHCFEHIMVTDTVVKQEKLKKKKKKKIPLYCTGTRSALPRGQGTLTESHQNTVNPQLPMLTRGLRSTCFCELRGTRHSPRVGNAHRPGEQKAGGGDPLSQMLTVHFQAAFSTHVELTEAPQGLYSNSCSPINLGTLNKIYQGPGPH